MMRKPTVGLDLGSRYVKMVALRKRGESYLLAGAGKDQIKSSDKEAISQSAVLKAVRNCLHSGKKSISRNSHFVMALAGPQTKVSSFKFPPIPLDEVGQAVTLEAAQICPFDIRSSVVDYQLIGSEKSDVKGVLAIAAKDEIEKKKRLAADALLKCVLMDSQGLALLNCLTNCKSDLQLPAAVINIDWSLTTIAILDSNGLPFVRDLRNSGSDIIANLAKLENITTDQAENNLFSSNSHSSVKHPCRGLINDITETLVYFSTRPGSGPVKKVFLCGEFAVSKPIAQTLQENIQCEISVWDPLTEIKCDKKSFGSDLVESQGPAFATAAGLAMRQV